MANVKKTDRIAINKFGELRGISFFIILYFYEKPAEYVNHILGAPACGTGGKHGSASWSQQGKESYVRDGIRRR
jgi:hypothetical protein